MRIALALSIFLFATPGYAQSEAQSEPQPDPVEEVEQAAREAAQTVIQALQLFVKTIPQYETPEIMPNGDIVIRRKPKPGEERQPSPNRGPCEIDGEITI